MEKRRKVIFLTSRWCPITILVRIFHVPSPSTVWTWEGKVTEYDEHSSSWVLARLCITKSTYSEPHSTIQHQWKGNVVGAKSLKLEDLLDTAANVTNSRMW